MKFSISNIIWLYMTQYGDIILGLLFTATIIFAVHSCKVNRECEYGDITGRIPNYCEINADTKSIQDRK